MTAGFTEAKEILWGKGGLVGNAEVADVFELTQSNLSST